MSDPTTNSITPLGAGEQNQLPPLKMESNPLPAQALPSINSNPQPNLAAQPHATTPPQAQPSEANPYQRDASSAGYRPAVPVASL
jgi:hypothetical protein